MDIYLILDNSKGISM